MTLASFLDRLASGEPAPGGGAAAALAGATAAALVAMACRVTARAHINLQEIAEDDFARAARDTLERLAAGAHARRALAQRIAVRAGAAGHDAGGRA